VERRWVRQYLDSVCKITIGGATQPRTPVGSCGEKSALLWSLLGKELAARVCTAMSAASTSKEQSVRSGKLAQGPTSTYLASGCES
jgi:hypothetical protein